MTNRVVPLGSAAAPPEGAARGSRVQSVDRAALLLQALAAAPQEASAASLAAACGLNRATAWRILSTLETHDLVQCDRSTGRWSIGLGLVEIAHTADAGDALAGAHAVLNDLAGQCGETAALALMRGGVLTYVDEVAPSAVVAATWARRSISLHATSTGKVVLAWSSPEDVTRLLAGPLEWFTPATITSRDELDAELRLTRERGWATCEGEFDAAAYGVSAPVLGPNGDLLAVLSIWGPHGRVTPDRFDALGALTVEASRRITH